MLGRPLGRVTCGPGGDLRPAAAARHSPQSHACDVEAAEGGKDARQLWRRCGGRRGGKRRISPGCSEVACGPLCHAEAPEGSDSPGGGRRGQSELFTVEADRGQIERTIPVGSLPEPSAMSALPTPPNAI